MEKKITVKEICLVELMVAAVYVASEFLQIPIPTAIGNTRLHMGNVMCLLSRILLGPVWGGLSAGIGSTFFDLTNLAYITSAPFTFAFKFIMAWICGMMVKGGNKEKRIYRYAVAAALGAFAYVVLYLTKGFVENYFVLHIPFDAVWLSIGQKGIVSVVNAVVSVIVVVPLSLALKPAISRMLGK